MLIIITKRLGTLQSVVAIFRATWYTSNSELAVGEKRRISRNALLRVSEPVT